MLLHFDYAKVGLKRYFELETGIYDILKEIDSYSDDWNLNAEDLSLIHISMLMVIHLLRC